MILSKVSSPEKSGNDIDQGKNSYLNEKAIFVSSNKGLNNELRGTYVPFRIFQIIAIWADKKHLAAILVLLEKLNDNKEIEELKSQCEKLKEQHEDDFNQQFQSYML